MRQFFKDKTYLFVYGSLPQYLRDNKDVKNLGFAQTVEKFTMHIIRGKFPFPAIQRNGKYIALGTLYEIDSSLIPELDMYEGSPDFFKRETVNIQNITDFFDYPKPSVILNSINVQSYIFQEHIDKYPADRVR